MHVAVVTFDGFNELDSLIAQDTQRVVRHVEPYVAQTVAVRP